MICRACNSNNLNEVLDMGMMPLAGDFHSGRDSVRYPLVIDHCKDCDVLQVRDLVPHEVIFNDKYCYASSTVPALIEHFRGLAGYIKSAISRTDEPSVLEIGCNDGVLLSELDKLKIHNVGMDASANMVQLAQSRGCNAIARIFSKESARAYRSDNPRGFDLVTCSNMFAHNADPNDILDGIKLLLKPGGHIIIEVHDAKGLHDKLQWDCFYHEHCFYWSRRALRNILEKHGFRMETIQVLPMHGCALRAHFIFQRATSVGTEKLADSRPHEAEDMDWRKFGDAARASAKTLKAVLTALRRDNATVNLYATAGRAVMLVNFAELGSCIDKAFDGSPFRAGKEMPGTTINILPERSAAAEDQTTYWLLGAWHLEDALVRKIKGITEGSRLPNRIIVPLPSVKIY